MSNNEDYLDSLLKANENVYNPNSAIERVREYSNSVEDDTVTEEKKIPEDDTVSDTVDEPLFSEETNSADLVDDSLNDIIADLDNNEEMNSEVLNSDEINLDEMNPEEINSDDIIPENVISEDVISEDAIPEDLISDDVIPEDVISDEAPETDMDSLLKDDFSGEIDISSLLDNAEAYANDESLEDESLNTEISDIADSDTEAIDTETIDTETIDTETIDTETIDTETIDTETIDTETIDTEAIDTEAIDTETIDTETIDIDAYDTEVLDPETLESEIFDTEEINDASFDESLNELLGGGDAAIEPLDEVASGEESLGDVSLDVDLFKDETESVSEEDISSADSLLDGMDLFGDDSVSSTGEDISDDEKLLDFLNNAVEKQEEEERLNDAKEEKKASSDDENVKETTKEKKKLFNFKKKEKTEGEEEKPKKETFFGKIINFLTAEEEENTEEVKPEEDLLVLPSSTKTNAEGASGENQEILDAIDKEKNSKKDKKKNKKDKKGKAKSSESDDESEDLDDEEKPSSDKKKKAKKPKKEKKPLELDIDTGKPLSKKNVRLVFILALSILVLILLGVKLIPSAIGKDTARKAFYKGDYETTYQTFMGADLNESDKILFEKSEILLKIQHKYTAYTAYMNMSMPSEALDQLLQAVANYDEWFLTAETFGVTSEFNDEYAKIISTLNENWGLSEEDAREINALATDLEYSLKVYSIVNHTDYIDINEEPIGEFTPESGEGESEGTLEDMLSEEGF